MKYKLIADTSCDLFDKDLTTKDVKFSTVPLTITVADKDFVDDENLDIKNLMKEIAECKESSKSACPSPEAFASQMREADNVFVVTISSKLSGTYNAARLGAEMIKEESPEKNIYVLDSLATSSSMILLLEKLSSLIKENKYSFEEIKTKILKYRATLKLKFIVLDLGTLIKTGRMSKIAGLISKALSIVPVCGDNGSGEIKVFAKAIGNRKAISVMSDYPEEKIETNGKDFPIVITHNQNEADALKIKDLLIKKLGLTNIRVKAMRGLASFYANDKGIIMAY